MARRRDFARGAVAIRQSRLTTWFQFDPTNVIVATGSVLVFSLNAAALALRPFTIVRTRFEFGLRSDQAAAVERQVCALGIAVVSDEASAVGITAIPTPITESASNLWFLHAIQYCNETSLTDRAAPMCSKSLDSKAMRKVEVGQDVVVVVEASSISDGLVAVLGGRMLIKNN